MATTGSPTTTFSDLPSSAGTSPGFSTLRTAMSLAGSRPTMRAARPLPSEDRPDLGTLDVGRAGDHVVVGDDVAVVGLDDDARTGRPCLAPRTSIETTAGVTRSAMSDTEPGSRVMAPSTSDSSVPGASSRVSAAVRVSSQPHASADRADQQDSEQRQHREPHREVAQAQLLPAATVDDDRARLFFSSS